MNITCCSNRLLLNSCKLEKFDYQIDPYIGCEHYCYYCYVLDQAETDWRSEIMIYEDIGAQLSREIKGIQPQTIYIGNHTDPYQPCETTLKQTRTVLKTLFDEGFSANILTKSDLVVRDLDIIKKMGDGAVSISVAFTGNKTHRIFEANTPETVRRIEALKKSKEAGVKTGALICPVVPLVTDVFGIVDMLESYADTIWVYGLSFANRNFKNRKFVEVILNEHYPDLAKWIIPVIDNPEHDYWKELAKRLKTLKSEKKMNMKIHV